MTPNPRREEPDDSDELDSEEIVNDSLGEETPADSTGLDAEEPVHKQRCSA